MKNGRILVVDTETGGVGPDAHQKYSIFQLGAVLWDNGKEGKSFEIVIREPTIVAQHEALIVNGFTAERLLKEGVGTRVAVEKFVRYLVGVGFEDVVYGDEKIILGGHNVSYDYSFLCRLFRLGGYETYPEKFFSHRMIDTAAIARFLILAGLLPEKSAGSRTLFEHFGCAPTKPHDALSDATATANLLSKMLEMVKQLKDNPLIATPLDEGFIKKGGRNVPPSQGRPPTPGGVSELEQSVIEAAKRQEEEREILSHPHHCPTCRPYFHDGPVKKYC